MLQYFVAKKGLKLPPIHLIDILNTLLMMIIFSFYLLGHDFDHGTAFQETLFVILFKSSTICRIFRNQPLFPCLSIFPLRCIKEDEVIYM